MKKIKLLSVFLTLFTALGFTSCTTEALDSDVLEAVGGGNNGGGSTSPASFKVDFGGQTYVASGAAATVSGGAIAIVGIRGTTGENVSLMIPGVATGTYTNAMMTYMPSGTATTSYVNINSAVGPDRNGTVVISSINTANKTISGTFNFTGYFTDTAQNLPPVLFTAGTFVNVPYTGTIPGTEPNPGPTTKYFKAKIDGNLVNFANVSSFHLIDTYRLAGSNIDNSMSISVPDDITVGTYPIGEDFDGVTAGYIPTFGGDAYYSEPGGSITIESVSNGWIKGTFAFTGEDFDGATVQVTEGSFNMPLP